MTKKRQRPPVPRAARVPPAVEIYLSLMEDVKRRIALVRRFAARTLTLGAEVFDYECVSLQLRKILELIAFSSLCANRDAYASVHANVHEHWRAVDMLDALRAVHSTSTRSRRTTRDLPRQRAGDPTSRCSKA